MTPLAGLPDEARTLALDRFRLLQPHLEDGRSLKIVAAAAHIPFRTAQRWVSRYRQFGLTALARKKRTDTGQHRELSATLKNAIEGVALQKPPLPVATICRQARRIAQHLGEAPPSYWVVYRIVSALPADLVTLAHQGTTAYSQTFELIHRREADRPNAIWQADHTLLDILLVRPDGPPAKPWLTTVIDDHSRAVAGYFLSFEAPSALHTSLALREAMWRKDDSRWRVCGIPDVLYTDNGRDFRSRHLEQVSADLNIRLVFSIPGKPRGRGRIERFFCTVNEMFLCELEGYAPVGRGMRGTPTLTMAAFEAKFRTFLLDIYHRRDHADTKMPPVERWEANGFLPRMPDSLEQLDLLLIQVAQARHVRPDGIHFQRLRYLSTTLASYVGETVTLRIDPRDMAEIRVFHNNTFLCRAVCAELAGETMPLRDILRARNRRRRELRGMLRDRATAVNTLLDLKRGDITKTTEDPPAATDTPARPAVSTLKRYRNE
ncbi:MAG: DDE-type integrase/transposase/recombinase [Nitrospira sp.]|jgi:putative transposase|nr:DDE-type integrase/transposase/recombinase [Nitrospira sp.]